MSASEQDAPCTVRSSSAASLPFDFLLQTAVCSRLLDNAEFAPDLRSQFRTESQSRSGAAGVQLAIQPRPRISPDVVSGSGRDTQSDRRFSHHQPGEVPQLDQFGVARIGQIQTLQRLIHCCPSEVLSLRWQDVDWAADRIVVQSPKTEHHAGKARRTIPMFPELRPILAEAFDRAADGAVYVVDESFRKGALTEAGWLNANLRTTFEKIVRRAGLETWPRLFHNLRASRETELVDAYPVQVVTSWLGNTPSVAMRHYLMTTDEHFEAAIRGDDKAAQKTAQQAHAASRHDSHVEGAAQAKNPCCAGVCCKLRLCANLQDGAVPTLFGIQTETQKCLSSS